MSIIFFLNLEFHRIAWTRKSSILTLVQSTLRIEISGPQAKPSSKCIYRKKPIDLSFSNFTLFINNGTFIMDKASQVSLSGEVQKPTEIFVYTITRTLIIKTVAFNIKSHGNVTKSEGGVTTGYNLKADGPMHISDIKVWFAGPLETNRSWTEMVKMPECNAKVGRIDIKQAYATVLSSQSGLQKEIEDAIRSAIEKHICTSVFAEHRYPMIEHHLSQYNSGENFLVNYRPEFVTYYHRDEAYRIHIGGKLAGTDAVDPVLSKSSSLESYERCILTKKTDLVIWVDQSFFETMLQIVYNNKIEYR